MTADTPAFTIDDPAAHAEAVAGLRTLAADAATAASAATDLAGQLSTPPDAAPGTVVPPALASLLATAAEQIREAAQAAGTAAVTLTGTAERLGAVQGSTGAVDDTAAADVRQAGED